jgi:peptidoglycan/LPS O-acetylase OafA/YrhL
MKIMRITYRADVDGLRAVAVIAVLIFHAFPEHLQGGFTGVDVFFVISGFLITSLIKADLESGTFSLVDFYFRRFRRLFPALILVLGTCITLGLFLLLPGDYAELGKETVAGAAFVSNILYWFETGYFTRGPELKPLLHLWSLGIEEQFYLLWAPLLLFLRKRLALIIGAALILSLALNIFLADASPSANFYLLPTRLWELAAGAVLIFLPKPSRIVSHFCGGIGLAILVFAFISFTNSLPYPGVRGIFPVVGTALIIFAGVHGIVNQALSLRPVVFVGLISYPLYLWHWPLLFFAKQFRGYEPTDYLKASILLLSAGLAAATYVYVERPIRFRTVAISGRALSLRLYATFVAILLTVASAPALFGVFRTMMYPAEIRLLASFKFDRVAAYREGTCFLRPNVGASKLKAGCVPDNPDILLWGDSQAAHLYPGLVRAFPKASIAQLTAAGCPPLLNTAVEKRPICAEISKSFISSIRKIRPRTVIIAADWDQYDLEKLPYTVAILARTGASPIYIIGPIPKWKEGLPTALVHFYEDFNAMAPEHMTYQLEPGLAELDKELEQLTAGLPARYVSAYRALCTDEGCMTNADGKVYSHDTNHFTKAGSIDAIARFGLKSPKAE